MRCPHCGSSRLAVNPVTGELVCQECGSIVDADPLDDSGGECCEDSTEKWVGGGRRAWRVKRLIARLESLDTRQWGKGPESTHSSNRLLVDSSLVELVKESLPPYRVLKRKTLIAVALYVQERSEGASMGSALKAASTATGVSEKTLERIIRAHWDLIEDAVRRVARR